MQERERFAGAFARNHCRLDSEVGDRVRGVPRGIRGAPDRVVVAHAF
jgi:hypothetical protein